MADDLHKSEKTAADDVSSSVMLKDAHEHDQSSSSPIVKSQVLATSKDAVLADEKVSGGHESVAEFSEDEETLILRMYNLVGEKWSLIAGRIPGRSAEDIEKYWRRRSDESSRKSTLKKDV